MVVGLSTALARAAAARAQAARAPALARALSTEATLEGAPEPPSNGNSPLNPYTGDPLGMMWPYMSAASGLAALEAADRTFQSHWRPLPLPQRADRLLAGAAYLKERREEVSKDISASTGKPLKQALLEVDMGCRKIKTLCELAPKALAAEVREGPGGVRYEVHRAPKGVVDVTCPWNYPLLTALHGAVPALLAGNVVALKHQSVPLAGEWLQRALGEVRPGVGGLLTLMRTDNAMSSWLATNSGAIKHRVFTGSTCAGREISASLAARAVNVDIASPFITASLELGGSDAAYVDSDVPAESVPKVARLLADVGRLHNAGQACCAVKRLLVHDSHYDEVAAAVAAAFAGQKMGDPMDPTTTIGPIFTGMKGCSELFAAVLDAQARGARVVVGGEDVTGLGFAELQGLIVSQIEMGWFFKPTLLLDCTPGMAACREETFGPLLAMSRVGSVAEAAAVTSESPFGLTSSIWTQSEEAAAEFIAGVDTGTVFVNDCNNVHAELAWCGTKFSGNMVGGMGLDGFRAFTYPRSVLRNKRLPR